jgi:hypothetical protein
MEPGGKQAGNALSLALARRRAKVRAQRIARVSRAYRHQDAWLSTLPPISVDWKTTRGWHLTSAGRFLSVLSVVLAVGGFVFMLVTPGQHNSPLDALVFALLIGPFTFLVGAMRSFQQPLYRIPDTASWRLEVDRDSVRETKILANGTQVHGEVARTDAGRFEAVRSAWPVNLHRIDHVCGWSNDGSACIADQAR